MGERAGHPANGSQLRNARYVFAQDIHRRARVRGTDPRTIVTPSPKSPAISAVFSPLGDHAVTITVGDSIDEATHRRVRAVSAALDARGLAGVVDQVPAFASLVVHYDPERVGGDPAELPYRRLLG